MDCWHEQAEQVVLSTGETVACVCTGCLEALPANYVARQYELAYRVAYCPHDDIVEAGSWEDPGLVRICTSCGGRDVFINELRGHRGQTQTA
jgi:hypothetical protein